MLDDMLWHLHLLYMTLPQTLRCPDRNKAQVGRAEGETGAGEVNLFYQVMAAKEQGKISYLLKRKIKVKQHD